MKWEIEVVVDNKYKNKFNSSRIDFGAEAPEDIDLDDLDYDDLSDWMKDLLDELEQEKKKYAN